MRIHVHKEHRGVYRAVLVSGRAARLPPVQVDAATKQGLLDGLRPVIEARARGRTHDPETPL